MSTEDVLSVEKSLILDYVQSPSYVCSNDETQIVIFFAFVFAFCNVC